MSDVAAHLEAAPLPASGAARRTRLQELSALVTTTILDCRYHQNVVKLAAKFDEELKRLLDELRRQAHREWNLAHLCARLDYNSCANSVGSNPAAHCLARSPVIHRLMLCADWSSTGHASLGPAASLGAAVHESLPAGSG